MAKSNDLFYSYDIEACFSCVHSMIELGVFGVEEHENIIQLITNIVRRISESLQLQNEVKVELKSENFKELLL